jgi:hypothetical protein
MTDLRARLPWWNRRDFLKSSAAGAAGVYAMRWGLAGAADIPLEFDGSKFQLKAGEPNPKHGGVQSSTFLSQPALPHERTPQEPLAMMHPPNLSSWLFCRA